MPHHHQENACTQKDITLDTPNTLYSNSYAVVVSSITLNDAEWNDVVSHLFELHPNAQKFVYSDNDILSIRSDLQTLMPRYVAFVCQPNECGRIFVAKWHCLMRTLDDDPYIDAMWSIITGIDAEHALKSIDNESISQPFIIQRSINFTNIDQNLFETCFTFSDAKQGCWYGKNCSLDNGSGEERNQGEEYPRAPALIFTEKLNEIEPDLLITSGHGTEQSIEMPWSLGKLEVQETYLTPLDNNSQPVAPIIKISANPKIFLPIANCLVGHCNGSQCMVTIFLGRMGVRQMCGYTVRTWFGRAGWGTLDLWKSIPGRLTLADAYFLHQACMTYNLKSIDSRYLEFKFDVSDDDPCYETIVEQLEKQYHLENETIDDKVLEQIYGLCYDRDTFVFYGDPAFIAKLDENKNKELLTTKFLRTSETTHQFIIEYKDINAAQSFSLPIGNLFTNRIQDYKILNGFEYEPILTENFLIILKPTPLNKQSTIIKIDFYGVLLN
ncbi:unnamed protein product [Adineta steineri]|uniref:Uncharacterized protein n=1 Tax=Adineta steineri TaxID=433720 RepID=A0A813VML8_9BILA|nr:unnamed protein product [Adineta steineri]